jgi:hypothetical protein
MNSANRLCALVTGVMLALPAIGADAETRVYRWVDAQGVIHMGDYPPDHGNYEVVTMMTSATPVTEAPAERPFVSPSAVPAGEDEPARSERVAAAPAAAGADLSRMSLEELDRRCDDAREAKIAPLRKAEIAKCKIEKRNDSEWCERFYADYGDGGLTAGGTVRPRMFDDLPECVDAFRERNRRPR